jgi:phosphohistidine swiveling domain-containing protein
MAINVDHMRKYIARLPGADPDDFERAILGTVRGRPAEPQQRWRIPWILAKLSANSKAYPKQTRLNFDAGMQWWRHEMVALPNYTRQEAVALFDLASRRHAELVGVHSFGFLLGQNHYSKLAKLCAMAGLPGHELRLTGSGEGTIESEIVDDVALLAAGELTIDVFVDRHGYRGPDEGELSARSWREDPSPVVHLAELYARNTQPPRDVVGRYEAAVVELRAAVPKRKRNKASKAVTRVVEYTHLREIGKANFVRTKDVARAAARHIGDQLVASDLLDHRDDVFFLTRFELGDPDSVDLRATVDVRKRSRLEYEAIELPDHFEGVPVPLQGSVATHDAAGSGTVITGIAASPGDAEGVARVVRDPSQFDDFEPGDVLICELTDPAWAPLLMLAAAVVIDIGGALSHGAIVARELGIPAVIGTGNGSSRIADGSKVRVDGTGGLVTIL